jgi:hypothetical protein
MSEQDLKRMENKVRERDKQDQAQLENTKAARASF